jgi:hypothetical protein
MTFNKHQSFFNFVKEIKGKCLQQYLNYVNLYYFIIIIIITINIIENFLINNLYNC